MESRGDGLRTGGETLTRFQPMSIHFQLVPDPVPVNACCFFRCDKAHKRLTSPADWRRLLSVLSSSEGPSPPLSVSVCLCFSGRLHTQSSGILPLWRVSLAKWLRDRQSQDHLWLRPPRKMWVPAVDPLALWHRRSCRITWHAAALRFSGKRRTSETMVAQH